MYLRTGMDFLGPELCHRLFNLVYLNSRIDHHASIARRIPTTWIVFPSFRAPQTSTGWYRNPKPKIGRNASMVSALSDGSLVVAWSRRLHSISSKTHSSMADADGYLQRSHEREGSRDHDNRRSRDPKHRLRSGRFFDLHGLGFSRARPIMLCR